MSTPRTTAVAVSGEGPTALRGTIGVFSLIATALAYNGPMVVFLGFIPAAILLGNGVGTPVMFLLGGLVALLLASGIVEMSLRLPKPGGFYTYTAAGLNRAVAAGAGATAMLTYLCALIAGYVLFGLSAQALIGGELGGPDAPWWLYAGVLFIVVLFLGYANIDFSARVLVVFLSLEVLLMVVYDVAVIVQGGAEGLGLESFQPEYLFSGSVPIAFLFGVAIFGGFEATVIFRDEVARPERTIPRATYAVVLILAVLFAVTAWTFIQSYGPQAIMSVLTDDVVASSTESVRTYTGEVGYIASTVLLATSAFALVTAAHNVLARYLFNFSVDGLIPSTLSRVHERHGSPHRASVAVSILSLLLIAIFGIAVDGSTAYVRLAGVFTYTFTILLAVAALAITIYLLRQRAQRAVWRAAGTAVAFVSLSIAVVLATINFDLLAGTTGGQSGVLLGLIFGLIAAAVVAALVLRKRRPQLYARIGRNDPDSLDADRMASGAGTIDERPQGSRG